MPNKSFLEVHKEGLEALGFWTEDYRQTILKQIECRYNNETIRNFCVADVVMNGEKVLIKWVKRFIPLTDEDLLNEYGRDVNKTN